MRYGLLGLYRIFYGEKGVFRRAHKCQPKHKSAKKTFYISSIITCWLRITSILFWMIANSLFSITDKNFDLSYHLCQNVRDEACVKQVEGKTFLPQVLERCSNMVKNAVVDNQKAVMHLRSVFYRQCGVLSVKATNILCGQPCIGLGVNGDIHATVFGPEPFKNRQIHIIVYQYDLLLCLTNKALKFCVCVKNLTLEEDALGIIDFVTIHSCKQFVNTLI